MVSSSASMPSERDAEARISIVGDEAALNLVFFSRPYADSMDGWSRNVINAEIEAVVPGFTAHFTEMLHLDELLRSRGALAQLYSKLHGQADLYTLDGGLEARAAINAVGQIHWSVSLQYPVGTGALLRYEIGSDQSYLPALISQIDAVLTAFPVLQT